MVNLPENKFILHTYSWLAFYCGMIVIVFFLSDLSWSIKLSSALILPSIIPIYIHFYLLNNFFSSRRYFVYLALSILLIVAGGFQFEILFKIIVGKNDIQISGIFTITFMIVSSTAIKYFKSMLIYKYRLQEIEFKHLQTELNLLKTQINPHFFFNTLNNLYAMSLRKSDEMPGFILKLSDMMRYILTTSKEKSVLLTEEIEFIKSYISLEKIRLENDIDVSITIEGEADKTKISPMIFIPFVENSFKHSIGISSGQIYIHLEINIIENNLTFNLENSKSNIEISENHKTGVGLPNIKRRLELLYPSKHKLTITDTDKYYKVELELTL